MTEQGFKNADYLHWYGLLRIPMIVTTDPGDRDQSIPSI